MPCFCSIFGEISADRQALQNEAGYVTDYVNRRLPCDADKKLFFASRLPYTDFAVPVR